MCKAESYVLPDSFDAVEFRKDVMDAKKAVGEAGADDAAHIQGLISMCRVLVAGGYVLLALGVTRPTLGLTTLLCGAAAAMMISLARCVRWTVIGHHVTHGGFDRVHKNAPGALPAHLKRGVFAVGVRRFLDWLDWMLPDAWNVEHNKMHHYYLSEEKDPDVVERNFEILRDLPLPLAAKYVSMVFWVFTWKLTYYSPNTFKELAFDDRGSWLKRSWPATLSHTEPCTVADLFVKGPFRGLLNASPSEVVFWAVFAAQWLAAVAPMVVSVLLPPALPLIMQASGAWPFAVEPGTASVRALMAVLAADALTNAHSFIIVACNHAGEDLYRYTTSCKAYSAEWFLRCAYSSANFECGSELIDITYGWLNYQIEHHMFPDMTPLQYRKLQPLIKSVCKKHGVLYIQENALLRTWKMMRLAVGAASMTVCTALLPPEVAAQEGKLAAQPTAVHFDISPGAVAG